MLRTFCKSKITGAMVTDKNLFYDGSIGIDRAIAKEADIYPGEQVQVLNSNNGERFITYVIEEESGSGNFVLYGPASRLGEVKDELVILSYCQLETEESRSFNPQVVRLGKGNKLSS